MSSGLWHGFENLFTCIFILGFKERVNYTKQRGSSKGCYLSSNPQIFNFFDAPKYFSVILIDWKIWNAKQETCSWFPLYSSISIRCSNMQKFCLPPILSLSNALLEASRSYSKFIFFVCKYLVTCLRNIGLIMIWGRKIAFENKKCICRVYQIPFARIFSSHCCRLLWNNHGKSCENAFGIMISYI